MSGTVLISGTINEPTTDHIAIYRSVTFLGNATWVGSEWSLEIDGSGWSNGARTLVAEAQAGDNTVISSDSIPITVAN